MPKLEGFSGIRRALRKHAVALGIEKEMRPSVIVGYTSNYALHVHENIEMKWRGFPRDRTVRLVNGIAETGYSPSGASGTGKGLFWEGSSGGQGQAKFLEQPARELKDEIVTLVNTAVENGATLLQALYVAGLRIQRESQLLVPVDTGNLKASAFTRKE